MKRHPKSNSSIRVDATGEEQRADWVRSKLKRHPALLEVFNKLLVLQFSRHCVNGWISKELLTMVVGYGADANAVPGKWEELKKKYYAWLRKAHEERSVWQNVKRLSMALFDLFPPDYHDPVSIVRQDGSCRLTGFASTPKPKQADEWRCTIDGDSIMTGPIRLISDPVKRIRQKLIVDGVWKSPKHFPDFQQFKRARWEQYRGNNANCDNGPTFFFADLDHDAEVFKIRAKEGEYADYVATIKSLDHLVRLPDGSEKKVSDLLRIGWDVKKNLLPLPVASPLAQDLMIVTKEGKVLICYDERCKQWNVSASAIPHKAKDAHGDDPTAALHGAIRRRTYEELGLHIDPNQISWMAFGVGQKFGHTGFVGQINLNETEQKIRLCFENRSERDGVRTMKFIQLEIDEVQKFLKTEDCRYFLRLGLHLCLWRKFPKRVKISAH